MVLTLPCVRFIAGEGAKNALAVAAVARRRDKHFMVVVGCESCVYMVVEEC